MVSQNNREALCQRGFSLLELMAVLAVMAVALSLVVPRMFDVSSDEKPEELKQLVSALMYASDMAVKQGVPIRWQAGKEQYRFERLESDGTWHPVTDKTLKERQLQQLRVEEVELTGLLLTSLPSALVEGSDPLTNKIGEILMLPDGTVTPAVIRLSDNSSNTELMNIEVGSGNVVYAKRLHAN